MAFESFVGKSWPDNRCLKHGSNIYVNLVLMLLVDLLFGGFTSSPN